MLQEILRFFFKHLKEKKIKSLSETLIYSKHLETLCNPMNLSNHKTLIISSCLILFIVFYLLVCIVRQRVHNCLKVRTKYKYAKGVGKNE